MRRGAMQMVVVAGLLIAGACTDPTQQGAVPSGPIVAAVGAERPEAAGAALAAVVDTYVDAGTSDNSRALVAEIERQGHVDDAPYLVDLIRVSGSSVVRRAAVEALAGLAGVEPPGDDNTAYVELGSWALDQRPEPGPDYQRFKAAAYGAIDEPFADLLASVEDPAVLVGLQWGGVPLGGIVELNDPVRVPVADVGWAEPGEIVYVVDLDGTEIVYPRRIIGRHELANDHVVGGPDGERRAFGVSYCSLCRSAVAFDRNVAGRELTFLTSGLLLNANKVMVDNETGTLWQQASGLAVAGPLAGERLDLLPVRAMTYGEVLAGVDGVPPTMLDLPEPFITDRETGTLVTYPYLDVEPLADYLAGGRLWFPVAGVAGEPDPLAEVATLVVGGGALAVDLDALEAGEQAEVTVGDRRIRVEQGPTGPRFLDPDGSELPAGREAWFSWLARHPGTERWPAT